MKRSLVTLSLVFLVVSACAVMGRRINEADVKTIRRCATTKADLLKKFGEPYEQGNQSGYDTMRWYYARAVVGHAERQDFAVFLNAKDVVVDYALNPVGLVQVSDKCK